MSNAAPSDAPVQPADDTYSVVYPPGWSFVVPDPSTVPDFNLSNDDMWSTVSPDSLAAAMGYSSTDAMASAFGVAVPSGPLTSSVGDNLLVKQAIASGQQPGVCASVKLQIDQTATMTRTAFDGRLTLDNGDTSALTDVQVQLNITDALGNPVNDMFVINGPTLSNLTATDGTGTLAGGSTGTANYTFIPTDNAAPTSPTIYNIGGTLSYVDPNTGNTVSVPLLPATITVYPEAKLDLNYFLQKDVVGDDPFTPEVEPSEPASLGLLVSNVGYGSADNLSITTAQPQITENQKGLDVSIQMIGTQVGTQQESPSLNVDFGNLAPGATADADFLLLSSLQGQFTNFTATFQHSTQLGGLATSLINSVTTHTLIHAGAFGGDDKMDYLVNDIPNPSGLPDTIYFSNGTTSLINIASNVAANGTVSDAQLSVQVTANVTPGWDYLQLPDPARAMCLKRSSDPTAL